MILCISMVSLIMSLFFLKCNIEFSTTIVLCLISLFRSVGICLIYLGVSILSAYKFTIDIFKIRFHFLWIYPERIVLNL